MSSILAITTSSPMSLDHGVSHGRAQAAGRAKVRSLTARHKHRTLADLLRSVNAVLRGWCNYFGHGVSARTFSYLDYFTWSRIFGWIRKRHPGLNNGPLVRRHLPGWEIRDGHIAMLQPQAIAIERYRYRGNRILTPWTNVSTSGSPDQRHEHTESRMR